MQTFLPYGNDYYSNASILDLKRLGKQRVENLQILNCLAGKSKGWVNHPAVRMWRGHEGSLLNYQIAICATWGDYGYKDSCLVKSVGVFKDAKFPDDSWRIPWWLEDEEERNAIAISHRSNLIRKNPNVYQKHWPEIPNDIPYHWPV